jgi:predicted aminopeptidase
MKIWLRRVGYTLLLLLLTLFVYNFELVQYGLAQAKGQFNILWQAKSIDETLQDPEFPDSLKYNLRLVDEIKRYAIDSLGLKSTNNYTTVYDQKGNEVLWVVSACAPYEFEPLKWSFPVIGSFSYKGFFDLAKARKLARELNEQGLDVYVRPVSGWSTLGWFRDPILSNMLADSPGELANTIIHELTHATLFIPDSMTFNENLATFIGNKGAEKFLAYKYGPVAQQYNDYVSRRKDSGKFTRYIVQQVGVLDSLYKAMSAYPDSLREQNKKEFISQLVAGLKNVDFINQEGYANIYSQYEPNNAYFVSFLDYRERQIEFDSLYINDYEQDLAQFINYWKELYSN